MTKLTRAIQKVFGSSASDIGVFGSAAAGTKTLSTDPTTIQSLGAWDTGWATASLGTLKFPAYQDQNAIDYLFSRQIAYMFQEGIPEYDATTTYYIGGIVKKAGTFEIYGSLVDTNLGNALGAQVDTTNWKYLGILGGSLKIASNLSDLASLATALTNLGFASDTASYFKVPNPNNTAKPWIVQFAVGSYATAQGTQSVNFPISFTNSCLFALPATQIQSAGDEDSMYQLVSQSATGCVVYLQNFKDTYTVAARPVIMAVGN